MKSLGCFKDIDISPLDGLFDARTQSGKVGFGHFRLVLNVGRHEDKKPCRLGGWKKLHSDSIFGFNNQDYHDQLINCAFYYESFSGTTVFPGESGGYDYPYFTPAYSIPSIIEVSETTETYCGYAPDFYGVYAYDGETNESVICSAFTGYPYSFVGPVYEGCNTGPPDYWQESYFHLCYTKFVPGVEVDGYGFGTPIPIETEPYVTQTTYCGDYVYHRPGCREAITMLFEAVSVAGKRKLIAGSKSRISVLNERSGNWRILADGLGGFYNADNCECSSRRFKTAQLGNVLLFTNDFDPVLYWIMDSGPRGCDQWSADYVPDLLGLGITRADVVASWGGFLFIGNVEVENERKVSRIYWSDFNNPMSWAPGGESAALYTELGIGERIVAIEPLGGQLRVYTKKSAKEQVIYDVTLVGGTEVFNFREIYRGPDGLEYQNSLVNIGSSHIYLSQSGIMVLSEFDRAPMRVEWMHKADGVIYSGVPADWVKSFDGLSPFGAVNKNACEMVVGGFDSERKLVWFSWPTDDNECPNMSLIINTVYAHASLVDHGFTAFCMHRPDFTNSVRDFLAEWAGCEPSEFLMPKEGEPYPTSAQVDPPAYIRNATEDPDLPVDPNSLCARMAGTTLEDLCESCDVASVFVMADASDKTLKEFTPSGYYRERYVAENFVYDCPRTTPGSYVQDGYYSLLQADPDDFRKRVEKLINRAAVDFDAEEQTTPNNLYFELAYGQQPTCMTWDSSAPARELTCLTEETAAEHATNNTRPDRIASYPFYRRGVFLGWRLYVNGTGGGACFNSVGLRLRLAQGEWV